MYIENTGWPRQCLFVFYDLKSFQNDFLLYVIYYLDGANTSVSWKKENVNIYCNIQVLQNMLTVVVWGGDKNKKFTTLSSMLLILLWPKSASIIWFQKATINVPSSSRQCENSWRSKSWEENLSKVKRKKTIQFYDRLWSASHIFFVHGQLKLEQD